MWSASSPKMPTACTELSLDRVKISVLPSPAVWPWTSHFASLSFIDLLYSARIDLPHKIV